MKKLQYLLVLFLIPALISFMGCKDKTTDPDPDPINETKVLLDYMEQTNYIYTAPSFVIGASDVRTAMLTNPNSQYIVDIRAAADFATGHIEGAVNVTFGNLLSHIKGININNYEKVVVACYSGQTSAYAISLIRALGGYNKVVSLKWGMSAWNEFFATNYWLKPDNRSNARAADFVTTPSPAKNPNGDLPTITTGKTNAVDILEERVKALFTAGYSPIATINNSTLFANLAGNYIINYWPTNLYLDPGHIPGAINYPPADQPFISSKYLQTLPIDKPVVLYCFTGQTSSYVGAYLRLLGYDAKSLLYGANAMIWNLMDQKNVANTFKPETEIMNYPYVTP